MARRGHGEGSIYKREDGRWTAQITVGPGQRRYMYGKTRHEVQEQLTAALRNQDLGMLATGPNQTVGQYLERWLKDVAKPGVRPRTFIRYQQLIMSHAIPLLGRRPLPKLMPQDLQTLYAAKTNEGLAPRTVGHIHRVLHRALGDAVRWGLVPRNVCDAVAPPRVVKKEMRSLTIEESRKLLAAAGEDPLEALYYLALTSGMRQGELLGLKWQDIDWVSGKLQVKRSIARVTGQGFVEMEPKSAKSRRSLTLAVIAVGALKRHRARQFEARLLVGSEWNDRDFVFCNALGRPLEPQNILRRSFVPLLEKAGLPRVRFHDLRHTAASLLLALGENPKIVQEILGHSQISLTLDTYSHVLPTLQAEAIQRLNALLEDQSKPTPSAYSGQ